MFQLVDGLSRYKSSVVPVFHRNPNYCQLVQDFFHPHKVRRVVPPGCGFINPMYSSVYLQCGGAQTIAKVLSWNTTVHPKNSVTKLEFIISEMEWG